VYRIMERGGRGSGHHGTVTVLCFLITVTTQTQPDRNSFQVSGGRQLTGWLT